MAGDKSWVGQVAKAVLLIFAVIAIVHVLLEIVMYHGSEVQPLHNRVLPALVHEHHVPDLNRYATDPSDAITEEARDQIPAAESGFFAYQDTQRAWRDASAVEFHWCSPHTNYHKGAYSHDECFEWITYRYMGPGQGTFHMDRRRGARTDVLTTVRNTQHRIAIVIPWTGKDLPKWSTYLFASMAANADIADWLFIVQDGAFDQPAALPPNLKLLWVRDFEQFFTARLGMPFQLGSDTRRFADVKPCYGTVLEPELKDYTHWAFADADMVYGKFSRMITPWELDFYDVISFLGEDASHLFNAGPLTIFKNNALSRTYWRAPDFWGGKIHTHVSHEGGQWAFDERLSSEVLWNMDNVRVLYTIGRLFNDLCSTPADYHYSWRNGMLKRYQLARDGRKIIRNNTIEEGIGIHFAMSKMMGGQLRTDGRTNIDPAVPFDLDLWPNFQFTAPSN